MNILHYNLGVPPLRSGGLTKYSIDLGLEQSKENNIYFLFPGGEDLVTKKDKINRQPNYKGIECYQINNSLPISLLLGIKKPKDFLKNYSKVVIKNFFLSKKIDIFHIHTFMGLNKEFLEIAKELRIKIIYTTHDYFGLCPKTNLLDYELNVCENYENGEKCILCNYCSPTTFKLNLLSMGFHKIYKKLKKIFYFKVQLEKNNIDVQKIEILESKAAEYIKLREDFLEKISLVDNIHYNSSLTKRIYEKYIGSKKGEIILISHNSLKKIENIKKINSPKLRIGFFGTVQKIKGFDYLYKEVEKIEKLLKKEIEVHVFGIDKKYNRIFSSSNFIFYGRYKQEDLSEIYKKIDYTVIPSIWWETFNLVSLESKFYETPVIISDKIGAKEIFMDGEKIEFSTKSDNLKEILEEIINKKIEKKISEKLNNNIWDEHIKKIEKLYKV